MYLLSAEGALALDEGIFADDRRPRRHEHQCPCDERSRPDRGRFADAGGTVHGFLATP
jgi:hypothetical protein